MKLPAISQVSFQDKLFFTKHLSTMIKAGIPLHEALETLEEQARSKTLKKIIHGISKQVKNGDSLEDALKKYATTFSQLYINLIAVGEESGSLEENLAFLSAQLAKEYALKKKIQSALLYPGLVFFSTAIMGGFIALYVLPKLVDFFDAFDFPLPLSTKILLFIANVSKNYGVLILLVTLILLIAIRLFVQLPRIKLIYDKQVLKLPLLGRMLHYNQLAQFSRNFGILLKSGLPITKSLSVTASTVSNSYFQKRIQSISKSLEKGKNVHDILNEKNYAIFPPLVVKMIGVGEKTGKLDSTLIYLGDFYEEEIDNISKNLSTVLEPILLLTIGLIVGFVALAIISPIYELTGSIRR